MPAKNSTSLTCIVYDISERKEQENRLAYLANFDALTGLPNRNLLQDRLATAIRSAERRGTQVAVLFFDLDHFKAVNDALGHHAGDRLLLEAAQRIKKHIRESDTAARLGGDEFVILLDDFDDNSQVAVVAENLLAALNQIYHIDNHDMFVSASMGITLFPHDGKDVETLLKNADAAMYLAKDEGRNNYFFFTRELNQKAHERLRLENSLRLALEREQYQLYLQPQVDLVTGRVIGAEALLRWLPDQNPVSPVRFIPILEETGMIIEVGKWVIHEACRMAVEIQASGYADFRIAVNLAARQLQQTDMVETVKSALQKTGLAAHCLEIELTESTLIDTRISSNNLKKLEELGVTLAIDDFGTGYSSLSYLQDYSVDVLKIDRSFIKDINIDREDDAVTSAIIALAHKLDMVVIAEGVETLQQLEFLRKQHCDLLQGCLIGRPMVGYQFQQWLSQYHDAGQGAAFWQPGELYTAGLNPE